MKLIYNTTFISLSVIGLLIVLGFGGYGIWLFSSISSAYKAKVLCSGVFVSHREPDAILDEDLAVDDLWPLKFIQSDIDRKRERVTASLFGFAKRTAAFRRGLGCTLVLGISEAELRSQWNPPPLAGSFEHSDLPWPQGEADQIDPSPAEIDIERLRQAVEEAFTEPSPKKLRRTRAVVVTYNGHLIHEKYATGFSKDTPLIGHSMTKSVMNALVGILVRQKRTCIQCTARISEWSVPNDPREGITVDYLLQMRSGLEFSETKFRPLIPMAFMMLLGTGDAAGYAAMSPLEADPGSHWSYSSGSTNILSRIMRNALGGSQHAYFSFPQRALFDRIGMRSAVLEPDAVGTFVGSSYMYATARDWARLGLLYYNEGVWFGERILTEKWIEYSVTPVKESPGGEYGAHFWLKIPAIYTDSDRPTPGMPSDAFHAVGDEGQFITVIPSRKLVVVRLGLSRIPGAWDHNRFIHNILEAFPE